jgi:hypothetical protein
MKAQRSWFLAALLAGLACSTGSMTLGCELLGSSKVAQGQRYQSEDQRYDPYFDGVYQQQVAAAAWYDDKKAARRSLIGVLALTPSASDDTIVSATRERAKKLGGGGGAKLDLASAHVSAAGGAGDPQLFAAVEELVRLELERARKLKAASEKLEEMSRQGEEHKHTADRDFENRGAEKADDKKTDKRTEIRRELGGAIDATRSLARDASRLAKDAQLFLEDLGSALEAKDTPPRGRGARGEPKAPPPPAKADEPKKADEKKADEARKADEKKADDARGRAGKPSDAGRKPRPAAPQADKPADKPPADKPAAKPAAEEFTP